MYLNSADFTAQYKRKISGMFGKPLADATLSDKYMALASLVRDEINDRWINTNSDYLAGDNRQVFYFSLEFLVGQFLEQNLIYLGIRDICEKGLGELNINLGDLIDFEPDAGLGNGGLGRLAACFLDSLASMSLPGHGNGIRYKYGLFSQKIVDGYQVELPDNWLREINVWEIRKPDKAVIVRFGGQVYPEILENGNLKFHHVNFLPVMAVPYDVPVMGYKNQCVNTLRLWSAECVDNSFDFASFSRGDHVNAASNRYSIEAISEVLYPDDSNYQNRILRLKQQYFFVSAGLQSIVRRFKKKSGRDLRDIHKSMCVQINDTHPALAIPELMRILLDDEGLSWDEAWYITTHMIAYTNHTIMPEALEKWQYDAFAEILPRITMIVEEINRRFCEQLVRRYSHDGERVSRMSIIGDGHVRMAHLAIVGSFSVNGVAAVHTEILKNEVLRDFYELSPEKFNNKTNGITHRRWLLKANPGLTGLLRETIGDEWISDPKKMSDFSRFQNDSAVLDRLHVIKRHNKELLAQIIKEKNCISVDIDSIFDVQVKRIHAYKRQLMNLMHITYLYRRILNGEDIGTPRVFIMAGKAAPSYYFAKNVIKLACELSEAVNSNPLCKGKLSLVFMENYGIGIAERIFPATDISEQISTASKEASGTSNMKFMMNGAVTIGTGDGANIEIRARVGDENYIGFGLTVEEVLEHYRRGDYNSRLYYQSDERIAGVIDMIQTGFSERTPKDEFSSIIRSLLDYNDEYFILKDFAPYIKAQELAESLYRDRTVFSRMSLMNIAMSGAFSSDNTIAQYAADIWHIESVKYGGE